MGAYEEGTAAEVSGPSHVSQDLLAANVETKNTFPMVAVLFGLLVGSALAFVLHIIFTASPNRSLGPVNVSELLDVASVPPDRAPLTASYVGEKVSQADRLEARRFIASARAALAAQKADAAAEELQNCIKLADVPECHLELGLLLLVMEEGAGYAHLERYLGAADQPRDEGSLRRLLETVQAVDTGTATIAP